MGQATSANENDPSERTLDVPREYHKYLVGTKGATIQKIESDSGAKLKIPKPDENKDQIVVTGTVKTVGLALQAIKTILDPQIQKGEHRKKLEGYDLEKYTAETDEAYKKHQAEVDAHAKLRAQYFEDSKKAFDKGDKALAKELSEKGKRESELMEECQKKASLAIFTTKNSALKGDKFTIDLHGLHVAHALEFLTERIALIQKEKLKGKLVIITGAGIHSDKNGPKIRPAVTDLLKEKKLTGTEDEKGSISVNF